MKVMPWDPEWEQMREDRIRRREASDAAFEAVVQKRRENMKTFDPTKDTLLISSEKKSLSYRGFKLSVRVNKYKVAGPIHVIGALLPTGFEVSPGRILITTECDQNRAAAMRRIKKRIDDYLDARIKRGIAQLDAGQGIECERNEDGDPAVAEGTAGETAEYFCHAVDEHLAASLRTDDPMAEVIPDPDERAAYIADRF